MTNRELPFTHRD